MDFSLSSLSAALPDSENEIEPFRFFSLPYELRSKILLYILAVPDIIDLDPSKYRIAHQRLNLFLACRRLHDEAASLFYSHNTFRIFPIHARFFGSTTVVPLLARLPISYREALVSLQLRLGQGWHKPPEWSVDSKLGLEQMPNVRILNVFVEIDPSHEVFRGFVLSRDPFSDFAARLLEGTIYRLPALVQVVFDGWPAAVRGRPLMKRLVQVARDRGKKVIEMLE